MTRRNRFVLRRNHIAPEAEGYPPPKWLGLAKRLRQSRQALNLAAPELSMAAGLHYSIADCIEHHGERRPTIEQVERLAAALGVPVVWLAYGPKGYYFYGRGLTVPINAPQPLGKQPFRALCEGAAQRLGWYRQVPDGCRNLHSEVWVPPVDEGMIQAVIVDRHVLTVDEAEYLSQRMTVAPGFLAYGLGGRPLDEEFQSEQPEEYGDKRWERAHRDTAPAQLD